MNPSTDSTPAPPESDAEARAVRRRKLIGRAVLVVLALLALAQVLPALLLRGG